MNNRVNKSVVKLTILCQIISIKEIKQNFSKIKLKD